jgi:hypothetical protein
VTPFSPDALEALAALLTVVGPVFDLRTWPHHAALCNTFSQMQALSSSHELPNRTRYLLRDLLELRERGWVGECLAAKIETPKKLEEVRRLTGAGGEEDATRSRPSDAEFTVPARSRHQGGRHWRR